MNLSVIICTHNPRTEYLQRTLDSLRAQTLDPTQWELLLIDNSSAKPLKGHYDVSWQPNGRIIIEAELGLTPARLRGISEAQGNLLLFVDDDNVLANNYLSSCLDIATQMPSLGCFGSGALEPEFEESPADDLMPYTVALALRTVPESRWSNIPDDPSTPWGAGLCVVKKVALEYRNSVLNSKIQQLMDRKGDILTSGGDVEISWQACSMGMGRGIFPKLKITHLIDRRRVQKDYLLRIVEGSEYSNIMLDYLHGKDNFNIEHAPSIRLLVKYFLKLKPLSFFYECIRICEEFRMTKTQKEFKKAMRAGANKARSEILAANSRRID